MGYSEKDRHGKVHGDAHTHAMADHFKNVGVAETNTEFDGRLALDDANHNPMGGHHRKAIETSNAEDHIHVDSTGWNLPEEKVRVRKRIIQNTATADHIDHTATVRAPRMGSHKYTVSSNIDIQTTHQPSLPSFLHHDDAIYATLDVSPCKTPQKPEGTPSTRTRDARYEGRRSEWLKTSSSSPNKPAHKSPQRPAHPNLQKPIEVYTNEDPTSITIVPPSGDVSTIMHMQHPSSRNMVTNYGADIGYLSTAAIDHMSKGAGMVEDKDAVATAHGIIPHNHTPPPLSVRKNTTFTPDQLEVYNKARSTGLVSIGKGVTEVDLLSNVPVKLTARGVRCQDERDPVKDFIRTLQIRCVEKPAQFRYVFPVHGGVSDGMISIDDVIAGAASLGFEVNEAQVREVTNILGLTMLNNSFINFADLVDVLKSNAMEELLQQVDWENAGGRKKKIAYLREHNLHVKPENFRAADLPNRHPNTAQTVSAEINNALKWPSAEAGDDAEPGAASKAARQHFGRVSADKGTSRFVHAVYKQGGHTATDALRVLRTHIQHGSLTEGATFVFLDRNRSGEMEAEDIEYMCAVWGLKLSPAEVSEFMRFFRPSGHKGGEAGISYAAFCETCNSDSYLKYDERVKAEEEAAKKSQPSALALAEGVAEMSRDGPKYLPVLFLSIIQSMTQKYGSLRAAFRKLDLDGNGLIAYDEITKELHEEEGLPRELVGKVVEFLSNTDNPEIYTNAKIAWAEFLSRFRAAVLAVRFKRPDEHVEKAEISILDLMRNDIDHAKRVFNIMDTDGDGSLDEREFGLTLKRLGCEVDAKTLKSLVMIFDLNGDGRVDIGEFLHFMQSREAHRPEIQFRPPEERGSEAQRQHHFNKNFGGSQVSGVLGSGPG